MKTAILSAMIAITTIFSPVATARAATFDAPIKFSQAGDVTLTLDHSSGGYDHVLNILYPDLSIRGIVGVLTDTGNPSPNVLGFTPNFLGDLVTVGSFGANEELIFRLDNVGSDRLGTPGVIDGSIFSGSASSNNPGSPFTLVDVVDNVTQIVHFEDLFPNSNQAAFLAGRDVKFTLTLTPVPIPAAAWLFGSGVAGLAAWTRRRMPS